MGRQRCVLTFNRVKRLAPRPDGSTSRTHPSLLSLWSEGWPAVTNGQDGSPFLLRNQQKRYQGSAVDKSKLDPRHLRRHRADPTVGHQPGDIRPAYRIDLGWWPISDFELKPLSRNLGAVDYGALIEGRKQTLVRHPAGAFQLFRIGDAVASRNIHSAIYDALRLVKDL